MAKSSRRTRTMIEQVLAQTRVTVDELADEAGVSRATLYAWRNGKRNPTPENLAALAAALERRGGELAKLADQLRREAAGT